MEKQKSIRNTFLKFLPRATSGAKFQNPPFISDKLNSTTGKSFSSGVTSIIPAQAQEPTSPKVSCMGQINPKKKKKKNFKEKEKLASPPPIQIVEEKNMKEVTFPAGLVFSYAKPPRRRSHDLSDRSGLPDRAPSLSQMRRFASGRETVREIDWAAELKAVVENYDSGDEREDREEREVGLIPFSGPIMAGRGGVVGLEPRKEVNLWKRRTMNRPSPLDI